MITLNPETAQLIKDEMESIPEKYYKPLHSLHEGLAVLREEYVELEHEIFFGEKEYENIALTQGFHGDQADEVIRSNHRMAVRHEAIQVAAMACRIIQELT